MNIYIKVLVQSTSGPIYGENDKFVYFNFQTDNIVKYFFYFYTCILTLNLQTHACNI